MNPISPRRHQCMATAVIAALAILPAIATRAAAQDAAAIASWIAFPAPPGHEAVAARTLAAALPGWSADRWGNLVRRVGSGTPRRVVACAMDQSAYVVSQVTDDGYLRLRRSGVPRHPLWDQFHEGQRLRVFTATGSHEGVVAVPNGHFARQHRADTLPLAFDDLWVDVGASSKAEVARMGIALLDPVQAERPAWHFERRATGPGAGARAGCAAVAAAATAAAEGGVASGETIFILSTQRIFGWVGLSSALVALPRIDQLWVVDEGQPTRLVVTGTVAQLPRALRALDGRVTADTVHTYAPRVRWPGSLVETIDEVEADALLQWVARAGALRTAPRFASLDTPAPRPPAARTDGHDALERRFMQLADLPGVPGHEWRVRDAIMAALPLWARRVAVVDSIGNLVVTVGPDRDPIAFLAHMDEVAFEVDRILPDGRVTLRRMGGVVVSSWEGVPALLHFDRDGDAPAPPSLRGLFVPRDSGRTKTPPQLTAWFGMDSAQLVAAGVRRGHAITAYKRAARLAGARITARSTDDRAGSAALLTAVTSLDPAALTRRVHFVWTVQEEGGLNSARHFGDRVGRTLHRVYSIDTFVSSDTPLESPHFAFAPLGAGPVLRGLDDGSLTPRAERDRVVRIARAAGIPLQVGTTQGGVDGGAIVPWGAPNLGLSWPGRYSHGPAEVLDLRDVAALARLIRAVALGN